MEKEWEWGPSRIARLREKEAAGIRDYEYLVDRAKETKYNTQVIYRSGINKEPIEEWLENNKPSSISRDQGFGWMHVYNRRDPKNNREDNEANVNKDHGDDTGDVGNVVGLKYAWEDLLASKRQVCKKEFLNWLKNSE